MIYYWLKAGHIIFMIFWMAGLFMLPRFFVYHQECPANSPENAVWIEREKKLLKIILMPSIIVVWVLGLVLAYRIGAFGQGWFQAKLALVLLLSAYHGWLALHGDAAGAPSSRGMSVGIIGLLITIILIILLLRLL